jgi:uncharacterized protein
VIAVGAAPMLRIEVVYASEKEQRIVCLELPVGATVGGAIERSGLLTRYPEIDLTRNRVGIYSKFVTLGRVLRDNDRVEIYRPLALDPKEIRRRRAAKHR